MATFSTDELKLAKSKVYLNLKRAEDKDTKLLIAQAIAFEKESAWMDAALIYAALAITFKPHPDFDIHTAKTYRRANKMDESLRWYLHAAMSYANQKLTSRSIATLRLYEQLHPEHDPHDTQKIYDLCTHVMDKDLGLSTIELKQRAQNEPHVKLRDNNIFSAFDEDTFQQLLSALKYKKLEDKEVLARIGDEASSLYIVSSGSISGYTIANFERKHLGNIESHGVIGIIPYFMGGGRVGDFIANGECEVLELAYADLNRFKKQIPSFQKRIESLYLEHLLTRQLLFSELFSQESLELREWVALKMKPVKLKANEYLFHESEKETDLYIVRSGKLAVLRNIDGQTHYKKSIVSGGLAGEFAIIADSKRFASICAQTPCVLMKLAAEDYAQVLNQSPTLKNKLNALKKAAVKNSIQFMKTVRLLKSTNSDEILISEKGDPSNQRLVDALWSDQTGELAPDVFTPKETN